jgi:hypothetical protein
LLEQPSEVLEQGRAAGRGKHSEQVALHLSNVGAAPAENGPPGVGEQHGSVPPIRGIDVAADQAERLEPVEVAYQARLVTTGRGGELGLRGRR